MSRFLWDSANDNINTAAGLCFRWCADDFELAGRSEISHADTTKKGRGRQTFSMFVFPQKAYTLALTKFLWSAKKYSPTQRFVVSQRLPDFPIHQGSNAGFVLSTVGSHRHASEKTGCHAGCFCHPAPVVQQHL